MSESNLPWDQLCARLRAAGTPDDVEQVWSARAASPPPPAAVDEYLVALARLLEVEVAEALLHPEQEAHSDGREPTLLSWALCEWRPGPLARPALERCLARVKACLAAGVCFVEYEAQGGFPRPYDDRTQLYRQTLRFGDVPGHAIGAAAGATEEWAARTSWPDQLAAARRLRDEGRWAEAEATAESVFASASEADGSPIHAVQVLLLKGDLALARSRVDEADQFLAAALRRAESELPAGSEELRRVLDGTAACRMRQDRTVEALAAWARLLQEESRTDGLGSARGRDRLHVVCQNVCMEEMARDPLDWDANVAAALDRGELVDGAHRAMRPLIEYLAQRFRAHGLKADAARMERWRE